MTQPNTAPVTKKSELTISGTPLRHFKGTLSNITFPVEYEKQRCLLQLTGIEVIHSLVPYEFPTAGLNLPYSDKTKSGWGFILNQADAVGYPDIMDLCGHFIELQAEDVDYGEDKAGKQMAGLHWHILSVDGAATAGAAIADADAVAEAKILELINGKTSPDLSTAMLAEDSLISYQPKLSDGSLVAGLIESGKVTFDEGSNTYTVN